MFSLYGFWFSWNKALGYSILKNPLELIGIGIIAVILVIVILGVRELYKIYKSNRDVANLTWLLTFLSLLFAVIFLICEKLCFSTFGLYEFGKFMALLAFCFVGFAVIAINNFAFRMNNPERVKLLTACVTILVVIYITVLSYAIIIGYPISDVVNYELVYDVSIDLIVYPVLITILAIAPLTFFYFSSKIREENKAASTRALWMGLGIVFFGVGFIVEVAPLFPTELSIPLRGLFAAAAIIMYVCFAMPEWFKNKIGWTG